MKLAIMQPYLFPYIGYFQLINAVDKFVVLDDVNFINRGWINRNNILVNGKKTLFTLPLKKVSQNKLINKIEIDNDKKWKTKFLKTLKIAYKKAPFFNQVFFLINDIMSLPGKSISAFNYNSIIETNRYLEISTELISSSTKYNNSDLKGEERIINICEKEGATQYINPIGGAELYDNKHFASHNINLSFIKPNEIKYKQFNNRFELGLSIIDVLMFNSKEHIKKLLNKFELI